MTELGIIFQAFLNVIILLRIIWGVEKRLSAKIDALKEPTP